MIKKTLIIIIFLLIFVNISTLHGQILEDSASFNLVKKGVDYIYNFRFNEAKTIINKIDSFYPGHPIGFLFRGMLAYWQNYPLIASSSQCPLYEKEMQKCIDLCERKGKNEKTSELLLINLCARGMLLMFYSDNNLTRNIIPLASDTYRHLKRSFDLVSVYSDFHFFTGLYNYYREVYPATYPIYKSFAFIFPKGDRIKGLNELKIAAKKSLVLKAESASFLSWIYLTYENNYHEASQYTEYLHKLYPENIQYLASEIKNLLLNKDYKRAENIIMNDTKDVKNGYFISQIAILNGIIQEKEYHNQDLAEQYYNTGISGLSAFGEFGNDYRAIAYFGLSRISMHQGDKVTAKQFRKKALDLADSRKIDFE